MYFGHMGGWGYGFGWITTILFWGVIIWAIVVLVRGGSGHGLWCGGCHGKGNHGKGSGAMDILKERYAKGEITKEQFEQMKKDLE